MTRPASLLALVAGAVLTLTACGGSDTAAPKPTAPASNTPTAAPTAPPAPTPSEVPGPVPMPEGKDGVTVRIANWEQVGEDAKVAAYKTGREALIASLRAGSLVPDFRSTLTPELQRLMQVRLRASWKDGWTVGDRVESRVLAATGGARNGVVLVCEWAPSVAARTAGGALVGKDLQRWNKLKVKVAMGATGWVMASIDPVGTCPGPAPA